MMSRIDTKGLLLRILIPTAVFSLSYLLVGYFSSIPHILLFCILGTIILVPAELGIILFESKKETGTYSLRSAFTGQEKVAVWKVVGIALVFFASVVRVNRPGAQTNHHTNQAKNNVAREPPGKPHRASCAVARFRARRCDSGLYCFLIHSPPRL